MRATRAPRSDAARNRERLLEAAKVVFSIGGEGASLEAVAARAGLGIGTLYRHFPTREALFEAVYRREVEHLAELAEKLAVEAPPVEALREWLRRNIEFIATKKGMVAALALAAFNKNLAAYSSERLGQAIERLLSRLRAENALRNDISAEELLRVLIGLCYLHDCSGWPKTVTRLMDIFVDGLLNV